MRANPGLERRLAEAVGAPTRQARAGEAAAAHRAECGGAAARAPSVGHRRRPGAAKDQGERGFTLLELLVVITIIGILATIAEPAFITTTTKAREATLKRDLYILRDVLDQYYADHGVYPATLSTLTAEGYLRAVPSDPVTRSAETWQLVYAEGGVFDIHSGSDKAARDGTPYSTW